MKDTCYITCNRNGIVKMNKQAVPKLERGERFFELLVEVPEEFFSPPPIPSVSISVARPMQTLPQVVISENQPSDYGMTETWAAQLQVNRAAARLLERGLNSSDIETQTEALAILQSLKDQGIEVDIVVPELEAASA